MKWVNSFFEKHEKRFLKGGHLEKYFPLFEMAYSMAVLPKTVTKKGPHVRDSLDTKRYMSIVIVALLPCLLYGIYNTGYQTQLAGGLSTAFNDIVLSGLKTVLPFIIVSYAVGGTWEVIFSIVRKHEVNEGFLVTGLLYPLILPPTLPLWQAALGISFGVVIGKEVFGGTGRNFLNPALTARAFVFFAYPAQMSGDSVWTLLSVASTKVVDAYSGATSLAVAALSDAGSNVHTTLIDAGFTLETLFWGSVSGSIGETSTFCALIGAAILLMTGIGSWRTMLGCLLGGLSVSLLMILFSEPNSVPLMTLSPLWHLCMGGFAFGTVFMATDPVSSPSLPNAKLVYGFLIGALAIVIRCINPAYPEGMMLSILLMNVFAPTIDLVLIKKKVKKRIPNVI